MKLEFGEPGDSIRRFILLTPLILMVLFILFILDLVIGSVNIPLDALFSIITGGDVKETWINIFWDWRLPKAITAVLVGGALALCGLLMQTFFRNPLADPYILGISSGASLGVAFVILAPGLCATLGIAFSALGLLGDISISMAAILGAYLILLIILLISAKIRSSITILILGIMISYIGGALVTILLQFSSESSMHQFTFWTFGSYSGVTWSQIPIMSAFIILGFVLSLCLVKPLNALLLGEQYAESMGLNFKLVRTLIIFTTALMAGVVTAFCGPIGFLGIAIPHLCRALFVTADHRILVPGCIMVGGIIALCTDFISHVPGTDIILPLNAVTALIGAPVVIWVIIRGTRFGRGVIT